GNGGVSHSEGQGYGMLIAQAYADRRAFDRIWQWTRKHLQVRPDDKLLAWKWTPQDGGRVVDSNNASDGDLLVAWALVRAWRAWGDFRYSQWALEILTDLRRRNVVEWAGRPALLPGTEGFTRPGGKVLNPSYYIFRALEEIERAFPGGGWAELAASGRSLLAEARFGQWSLAPDWVLIAEDGSRSLETGFPPEFGYNAVRVPLYLAWSDRNSPLLAPFAKFWGGLAPTTPIPATVNLRDNEFGPHPALPGVVAVAALAKACAGREAIGVFSFPPVEKTEVYYSAVLKILTKMAVRDTAPAGGTAL
ncbi:MAG: glycosyl hydrolase family 8, partial [Terrimicrobiaceae bacterium]|nr:glycosyl hydrolase family 8 [Terrimicrobiaceae bacterium]